eukprot:EG_transcript_39637
MLHTSSSHFYIIEKPFFWIKIAQRFFPLSFIFQREFFAFFVWVLYFCISFLIGPECQDAQFYRPPPFTTLCSEVFSSRMSARCPSLPAPASAAFVPRRSPAQRSAHHTLCVPPVREQPAWPSRP